MQAASIKYGRLCFYVSLGSTTDLILCLKYREILWVQRITKINITNKGFSTLQCFLLLWFVSLVVPVLFPSVPLFSTVVLSVAIDFRWFLFVCLFVLFVCLSVCLFVCLFVRSFVCLFVCLFVHYFMLNITVTQHSTAQYTESTVLPHCGLAQVTQRTLWDAVRLPWEKLKLIATALFGWLESELEASHFTSFSRAATRLSCLFVSPAFLVHFLEGFVISQSPQDIQYNTDVPWCAWTSLKVQGYRLP